MKCPRCHRRLSMVSESCLCGWSKSAVAPRPLAIAERSGYCPNVVCEEIRAAYRKSIGYRRRNNLRFADTVKREPGED